MDNKLKYCKLLMGENFIKSNFARILTYQKNILSYLI